jgi:hypothetical protein
LAYDSDRAGDKDIWLSGCEQGAWQPSFDVTSNSSDESMPVIIKINTGGRFALAFISNYTGNRTVFLTKSMDGIDWQVPVQIINDTELKNDELSTLTFILLQDDRGMLAYNAYDSLNNNYELKVVYSVDENLTNWTAPTRILPPSGDPYSAPHLIQNQSGIITLLYNLGYDVLYTEIDGNTMQIWSQPEKVPLQSTAAATNKFLNPWLIQSKADERLLVTDSSIQIRPDGDDWKEISNKTNENPVMIEITNTTALLSYKGEGGRIIVEEIQIEEGVPVTDEFDAALFVIFFLLALLIILAIVREIYMD